MDVKPISLDALPPYGGLDGKNADNYYKVGRRMALIYSEIIKPFEAALKETTGFSDYNMPEKEKELPLSVGSIEFLLRATPTTKRPGYREVVDELNAYLDTRLVQYTEGERPPGILTIDGEAYIPSNQVLSMIRDARDRILSKGVRISIAETPDLPEGTSMVVPVGMDFSEFTEGNAARYLEALGMQEGYRNLITAFEGELLSLTGFSDLNHPDGTEHMYKRLGKHIFHIKTVPYESTSWGKVLEGLDSKPPKKKPEKAGDLTLIERGISLPRLEPYQTRKREGQPLIRLEALLSRIESLKEQNTETAIRQKPINHYPIV
jgi:hypothetical protein